MILMNAQQSDTSPPRGDVRNRPDEGETDLSSPLAVVEYVSREGSFVRAAVSFSFRDFVTRCCRPSSNGFCD